MTDDAELLRRFAEEKSDAALAEFVRRQLDFVYAAALRQTRGNATLAQDVAQAVFVDLARKAPALSRHEVLVGWLHTATRFAAAKAIRAESRRQTREQEAALMNETLRYDDAPVDWERLHPVLDEVLGELKERERAAILLRFFEKRPFAEVGAKLAVTETAARSCVERGLEKMRPLLARRGVNSTAAALGLALAGHATTAAPAGLATSITGAALAGTVAGASGWLAVFMSMSKLHVGIAGVLVVAGTTAYVVQVENDTRLRREIVAVQPQEPRLTARRAESQRLTNAAAEVEGLRRDELKLMQLAPRAAAELKTADEERARRAGAGVLERRKELEEQIREKDRATQAEVARMNREGSELVNAFKAFSARAKDEALPTDTRAQAEVAAKAKLWEIQAKQREIQDFIKNAKFVLAQEAADLRRIDPLLSLQDPFPGKNLASPRKPEVGGTFEFQRAESGANPPGAPASPPMTFKSGPRP